MTLNKIRIVLIITLMTLPLVAQATAQERSGSSYTGLQVLLPDGDMGNLFDTGFGLTGSSQFPWDQPSILCLKAPGTVSPAWGSVYWGANSRLMTWMPCRP